MSKKLITLIVIIIIIILGLGGYGFYYLVSIFPPQASTAVIEGSLGYPNEVIPGDIEICAENIETGEKHCTSNQIKNDKYIYRKGYKIEVPAGNKYRVYSHRPKARGFRAYYSERLEIGDRCPFLITPVPGPAGQLIDGIDLVHWCQIEDFKTERPEERKAIEIDSPKENQLIQTPLLIKGRARGPWYFEGMFPIDILDGNGNLVKQAIIEAEDDWMTNELVSFETEVDFKKPDTKTGTIVFHKANLAGIPGAANEVRIQVRFDSAKSPREIAEGWIKENSPTYKFDGMNLRFIESRGLDLVDCENCYEVEFEFNSRHAGYGDRTGENLAQVITPHTIVVLVDGTEVKRAVADQGYDEINQTFLENE